jgi:phosphatidylserine/phosphatidylglycerophosphate/cardiolipin synthase-like enzyme
MRKSFSFRFFFLFSLFLVTAFYSYLSWKALSPDLPSCKNPVVLYSNQLRQDLKITLLKAIETAQSSLFVVMFGLSDPSILEALETKAKSSAKVKLFYDLRSSHLIQSPYFQTETTEKSGLMHQKIVVIDNKLVFLGSANLTSTSLDMHSNLLAGFYSPALADFLSQRAPHSQGLSFSTYAGSQKIELFLLPDTKKEALRALLGLIRKARTSLHLAMFTLTHPALTDSLIEAKKRGLRVTVIVDARSALGASAKSIRKLKQAGLKVLFSGGIELLHYKHLIIDDQILVSGSTNWTKAAFQKNHDCFFVLHNLKSRQVSFLKKLEKALEEEAL